MWKKVKNIKGELVIILSSINKKRNGKGKEYKNNKIIFEGEYLNGKRHGKGKEYDYYTGKLIFEGEYLEGKKWNGKVYEGPDDNGDLIGWYRKGKYVKKR